MRVVVTLEQRFDRTPDGAVWTWSDFSYVFWQRYLEIFDRVQVVARVRDVASVPPTYKRSDGVQADFSPIPAYQGPSQFLWVAPKIVRSIRASVGKRDAVIMRIGSMLATCLEPYLSSMHHPYGVEVVGDPFDVFAPGAIRHPLRPVFRRWFTRTQKRQCANACAAAYVTQSALQKRYPCNAHMTGVSDVEIVETVQERQFQNDSHRIRLITVGTLEQLYKSPDVLVRSVAECVHSGLNIELVLVGDGQYRSELERLANQLEISDRVIFRGSLPSGSAVRAQLDAADVFVLPSRTEGLPRAMVEAMARGLPCIGSTVGGIPELLLAEDMVVPGDVSALTSKISDVITNPNRMIAMSRRNLEKAGEFQRDALRKRRVAFYNHVRQVTEAWVKERQMS